jgi:ATP synthase F1 complex assembly factor 1
VCTNIHYQQATKDPLEKYKDKLEKKAREVGAKDIKELKNKLRDTIELKRKEFDRVNPLKELEEYERKAAMEAQERMKNEGKLRDPRASNIPEKPYKTMESFIALDKIKKLSPEEIGFIWKARFQNKDDTLISVVPSEVFNKLAKNARENPTFVLPLPRGEDGSEIHYVQWAFVGPNTVHCMFTTLLEFKTHKEYARPHTTVSFHTELKEDKGIVLMNGTVEKDSAVKLPEAQLLLLNVQRFYGAMADTEVSQRRLQLLKDFTSGSPNFSIDSLIEEAQSLEN